MKKSITLTLTLKIVLLGSALFLWAFAPRDDDPVEKIVSILQKWTDSIPQEKVYLHLDKPYYVVGDTIWFKGYVTMGSRHQLSAISGALYVDLISEKDSVLQTLKLPVTTGMAMGDFILNDEFKEGSYRLRAYTQWMRNAGPDYFYDHTFAVGDLANGKITTSADYQYRDEKGKPVLTATLNYADDDGKPLAGKSVHYQIMIDKKVMWSTTAKTDLHGSFPVRISNENHVDLSGAYITTTLDGTDGHSIRRDFPIKAMLSQSDVQFFAEGGSPVNGILSKMAFKAVGVDGLGVAITGKVLDNDNKQVAEFATLHAGMGSFFLKPEAGKTYTANISFADGTSKSIALPAANDDGFVLSVFQPNKDSVLLKINTSAKNLNTEVNLIAHSNGEVAFAKSMTMNRPITLVWLQKARFPTGIAQFTLFNAAGEPLNERIAFIHNNDQMQLTLKTAKASYKNKEHIRVDMNAADSKGKPTIGGYSVTVLDESKVPSDENNESTIQSNILLTSDLKGYVEKPNYYFNNPTAGVNTALDNLMLTQGYRRFNWKELNNVVSTKPLFPAEAAGIVIAGTVTTLNGKPLPGATVNLLSLRAKIAKTTITDYAGKFKFDSIFMTDSIKFAIQANKAKSRDVKIELDSIPHLKINKNPNTGDVSTNLVATLKAYLDNGKKEDDINEKLGRLDQVHRLREVKIRANKVILPTYKMQAGLRIPEGHADQTYRLRNAEDCAMLGNCLQGELMRVVFKQIMTIDGPIINFPFLFGPGGDTPMAVILDGRSLSKDEIRDVFDNNYIDPPSIDKIEVVRGNPALIAILGGPAIMIYTKKDYIRKYYQPNMVNITPKGFNKVRQFYSPKYDVQDAGVLNKPDLRSTVYWNPKLTTGADGKTTFDFYNADGPGTYKIIVEGINADGELGRQIYRYAVE